MWIFQAIFSKIWVLFFHFSLACELHFDNTPIPIENVLGTVGGGFKVELRIFCFVHKFRKTKLEFILLFSYYVEEEVAGVTWVSALDSLYTCRFRCPDLSTGQVILLINPLHPNISIDILHTLPYTIPLVLARRIGLTIRACLVGHHFCYSHDLSEWFSSLTVRRN
mgnify:CR=1 FL=1